MAVRPAGPCCRRPMGRLDGNHLPARLDRRVWLLVRTPVEKHDPAAIARQAEVTKRCLDIMDMRLTVADYLGGDRLSYADIVAGVAMYRWTTMGIERSDPPAVTAWHARLNERAAFRKAVNVDYEELRARLAP